MISISTGQLEGWLAQLLWPFIRVGSSGSLQDGIKLGELVISTGAVKLESTSSYFVPEGFPSVAHHEVVLALIEPTAAAPITSQMLNVGSAAE